MDEKVKSLLDEAASSLRQAKAAMYEAESLTQDSTDIVTINRIWWGVDVLHTELIQYLYHNS